MDVMTKKYLNQKVILIPQDEAVVKRHMATYIMETRKEEYDYNELEQFQKHLDATIRNFPKLKLFEFIFFFRQVLRQYNLKTLKIHEPDEFQKVWDQKESFASINRKQALDFFSHMAFKIEKDPYNFRIIANGRLLAEPVPISTYKTLLSRFKKGNRSYWEIFEENVISAIFYYDPQDPRLHYVDRNNHFHLNTYVPPAWSYNPEIRPKTFEELSPELQTFLTHLFPFEDERYFALKWVAYSAKTNIQTYLALIGPPGIGKTIFAQDFVAFYHGLSNTCLVDNISKIKAFDKTLFYCDEVNMKSLEVYNLIKKFTNSLVPGKDGEVAKNFGNVLWSTNSRYTFSSVDKNDRRFKMIQVAQHALDKHLTFASRSGTAKCFDTNFIKEFKDNIELKWEFVGHMLHILETDKNTQDINSLTFQDDMIEIYLSLTPPDFQIFLKTLMNIKSDFDHHRRVVIHPLDYTDEMKSWGVPFLDFVPLSALKLSTDGRYTYSIGHKVIERVIRKIKKHRDAPELTITRLFEIRAVIPRALAKMMIHGDDGKLACHLKNAAFPVEWTKWLHMYDDGFLKFHKLLDEAEECGDFVWPDEEGVA